MTKLRNNFLSLGLAVIASLTFIQPASADIEKTSRESADMDLMPITAPVATISYDRPSVSSTPAPVEEAPVVAVQYSQPEATTTETSQAPVAKKNFTIQPVTAPKAAEPASSDVGAIVASAALAQLGVAQDCTALVSNALAAAGIYHHGWPASYMALGTITTNPVPGDLIYYGNAGAGVPHIAVYIGNGQAVHGGWNGGTTAVFKANIGSGPVYIHI